jgi:uncharacterized protein (TIGR02118 family)
MAKMVVIYQKPEDVAAFERHYFEKHIPLAKRLPGIRKYEVSRGPIMSPAAPTDAWLVGTLQFDSLAAIREAFASEIGQECAADRREYAPDPAKFQMLLFDDKEV